MKYHSPLSIVIISVIVLLLFVSVAFFAVFSIGMTSPTLITAGRIMDDLASADSDFAFAFGSIDRNFRGGVTINDVSVSYCGESVLELDSVRLHMGIGELFRYAVTGKGRLDVEGSGGTLSFPAVLVGAAAGTGGEAAAPSLPSEGFRRSISFHLHDINVTGPGLEAGDVSISAYLDDGIRAEMVLPSVSYSSDAFSASGDELLLAAEIGDGITVSASGTSLRGSSGEDFLSVTAPVVRITADDISALDGAGIALSLSGAEGSIGGAAFTSERASLQGTLSDLEAVILSPSLSFRTIRADAAEADLTLREGRALAILDTLSMSEGDIILYDAERTEASYDTVSGLFSVFIPSFSSSLPSLLDASFTLEGNSIALDGSSDGSLSATGRLSAVADGSPLSGTGGEFSLRAQSGPEGMESAEFTLTGITVPGMDDEAYLFASYEDGEAAVRGAFGSHLTLSADVGEGVSVRMFYTDMPLRPFLPLVSAYVPVLYNYIGEDTAATGNILVDFGLGLTGPASFALALSDITFNDMAFSLAASGSGVFSSSGVDVDQLSITTDFIRASFDGSVSFRTRLPEGRFVVSMTDSGYELFIGTLTLESDEEYYFSARIPYFSASGLSGSVNWSDENVIESSAVLRTGAYQYPFGIRIDFLDNTVTIDNEMLHADVSFGEDIDGTLSFEHFELPVFREGQGSPTYLEGTVSASFSFAGQSLDFGSDGFLVGNIGFLPDHPDLLFSLSGDNNSLSFDDILVSSAYNAPLSGSLEIVYGTPSIAMSLSSPDSERLLLSIVRSDDGMFSGLLRADSFSLGRIGIDGMTGDINLTARAGTWDALSFSGSIRSHSSDMINSPASAEADLYIDSDEIVLSSITYQSGSLSVGADEIRYSAESGDLSASFSLSASIERADGPLPVSTSVTLGARLPGGDNLYDAVRSMMDSRLEDSSFDVTIGETDLGGMFTLEERSLHILSHGGTLDISGSLASGFFDIGERELSLYVDLMPVAAFTLDGSFGSDDYDAELRFSIDCFEISIADLFLNPSVVFYGPAPAEGEIMAVKTSSSWNLSGWLSAEEVGFDVFWMPGERVILHNPYFAVWDNSFTSLVDDCTVLDLQSYERTPGRVALTVDLGPSLSMDGWNVDVYAEEENWIGIRLPLTSSNIDIWGAVTGHLRVGQGTDATLYLDGDLKAADLTMSLGMEPIPEWMTADSAAASRTTADLRLLLTENVKFVFPLTGDPILRADLAENQNLNVKVDELGALDVSGSLDIRSGELFYFQKNFYITEGNISFRPDPAETASFNPIINLRARLRDFDSDGNPVDIYLILRDSTLDNLSPSFESSPSKPLSEIMQILGQSILPTSIYDGISVSSMVSLVSASVDILSRMGIITSANDSTLEQSIRSSLSLDTFSLHTNIIENLIFDTVAYASSNPGSDVLSPMARYLDGTTLYLGKYISPELYLEGMVHLDAENNRTETKHTFLADDLNLDIEVSLEWDNPLAVFTIFTRPENITLYDILDSFGFGFSKRIVW